MSELYLLNEKKYNYTTPKTFLEQISLYSKLLKVTTADVLGKVSRLQNGLTKLVGCSDKVS